MSSFKVQLLVLLAICLAAARSEAQWDMDGNDINPASDFLGTTGSGDDLIIKVYSTTGLRIEDSGGTPNVVGGYASNGTITNVTGASIGGGGTPRA